MKRHRWTLVYALAMLLALQAAAFAQEPKIGSATATKNKVEGVMGGRNQPLSKGSEVYTNETVRTGDASVADLVFIDNTNLSVGPTSEVKLDKFVYDPTGSSGAVVIQATKGAFRFVTGSQDKHVYEIKTPFGSLGVRGTIVEMVLRPCNPGVPRNQCGISLKLVEGGATFTTANGNTIDLSQANQVVNVNGNGVVTQSTQSNTILNFASAGSTAGSVGTGIGGGGGTAGSLGPNGGTNVGPINPTGNTQIGSPGSAATSLTLGGVISSSVPSFPSQPNSPH